MLPEESGTMSEFSNPLATKRPSQNVESLYEDVAEDGDQQSSYMNVRLDGGGGGGQITYLPHVPGGEGGKPAAAYQDADYLNGTDASYMNHVPATYTVAKPKKRPQVIAAASAPGVGRPGVADFVPLAVAAEVKARAAAAAAAAPPSSASAADPAQAWAAADFRHPAPTDVTGGGSAGGPKHAYMNVQLGPNGEEETEPASDFTAYMNVQRGPNGKEEPAVAPTPRPAARNSVISVGPESRTPNHSNAQLEQAEESNNGDKVFTPHEGFVHMKVADICKECRSTPRPPP